MKMTTFKELEKKLDLILKAREEDIRLNYKGLYKRIRKDLERIYQKHEVKGQINFDDLKKYKRLKTFDEKVAKYILFYYKTNEKLINNTMAEIVRDTRRESFEIINNKVSIAPIKKTYDIDKVINKEVAGHLWGDRLKHQKNNFIYDVHGLIHEGLQNGDTYTQVAKNLSQKLGMDYSKTIRIARTESARVQETSKFDVMEEVNQEIKIVKVWRTMRDSAVRDTHAAMEGQSVGFDEEFTLPSGARCLYPRMSGEASEDINCRCYLEYIPEKLL